MVFVDVDVDVGVVVVVAKINELRETKHMHLNVHVYGDC